MIGLVLSKLLLEMRSNLQICVLTERRLITSVNTALEPVYDRGGRGLVLIVSKYATSTRTTTSAQMYCKSSTAV